MTDQHDQLKKVREALNDAYLAIDWMHGNHVVTDVGVNPQMKLAGALNEIKALASLDAAASEQVEPLSAHDIDMLADQCTSDADGLNVRMFASRVAERVHAAQPAQAQAVPEWNNPLMVMPKDAEVVSVLVQNADTKSIQQRELRRVAEDDCDWRFVDDGSELSYDWSVIAWTYTSAAPALPTAPADEKRADEIVTALYRRFKDWSQRGFGPDDVTWCEVKADVMALIADTSTDALKKQNDSAEAGEQEGWMQDFKAERVTKDGFDGYRLTVFGREYTPYTNEFNYLLNAMLAASHHPGVQAISAQSTQTDEVAELSDLQTYSLDADGNLFACGFEPGEYVRLDDVRSLLSSRKGKDAEDARRYRWLRDSPNNTRALNALLDGVPVVIGNHNEFDAAIDSAIEQGKEPQ